MVQATDASIGIPLKGTLRKTSFSRILRHLARARQTGSLYLLSGKTKKVVFLESGIPVFVRSNLVAECLGQVLVRDGLITAKQCDQTLETMRRTGKQQGRLLVELGIISEGNLRYGLDCQLRQKLFDIFSWDDGRYQFKPEEEVSIDLTTSLRISTAGAILSGILETSSEATAQSQLREVADNYPIRKGGEPGDLELLPQERFLLESLDGSRTIDELLANHKDLSPTPVAVVVHALVQAGLCQLSRLARPPRMAVAKPQLASEFPDDVFLPKIPATKRCTEFEDTPLPGQLPQGSGRARVAVELLEESASMNDLTLSQTGGAYPDTGGDTSDEIDDTFGEEVLLIGEDDLEVIDDMLEPQRSGEHTPVPQTLVDRDPFLMLHTASSKDLMSVADPAAYSRIQLPSVDTALPSKLSQKLVRESPTSRGLASFNRGRALTREGQFRQAIDALEDAYELGIDVAELHAHLAWTRFKASGEDASVAEHALELLDYAQGMDGELDVVFAYRAVVLQSLGNRQGANREMQLALQINPDCWVVRESRALFPGLVQ